MKTPPNPPPPTGRVDVLVVRLGDALAKQATKEWPEFAQVWEEARPFIQGWAEKEFEPKGRKRT